MTVIANASRMPEGLNLEVRNIKFNLSDSLSIDWLHADYPVGSGHALMMIFRLTLLTFALLSAPLAWPADISGTWKHAKNPAWIEIRLQDGSATVVRNDKFPERVGREILKQIKASNSQPNVWQGLLYLEKLGKYKRVEISLPQAERMLITGKVGFLSRSVEWLRAKKID